MQHKMAHAVPCRATEDRPGWMGGPSFRAKNNLPDVCPFGIPLGYIPDPSNQPPKSTAHGPGDLLKKIIEACGFKQTKSCGCAAMQRRMNALGYVGCWTHRREILEWLQAKAKEQGVALEEATVYAAIKAAFKQYWSHHGDDNLAETEHKST